MSFFRRLSSNREIPEFTRFLEHNEFFRRFAFWVHDSKRHGFKKFDKLLEKHVLDPKTRQALEEQRKLETDDLHRKK